MTELLKKDRIAVTLDEGVAHVLLNRPEKMNALDPAMFDAIIEAGNTVAQAQGVRAVVLSGEGPSFCAGLDTSTFGRTPDPAEPSIELRTHGNANHWQEVAMTWRKCPVPVIAAVHGVCFGGGLQIASGADIRIVHPRSRMAIMEMKWGLVPDMGGFALWRGLVRGDVLRELVYTNREFSGEEARELGLATSLSDNPLKDAMTLARTIADRNPQAIRGAKRLFEVMSEQSTDDILMAESVEQAAVIRKPNQVEAVMAGMAKRKPVFQDG